MDILIRTDKASSTSINRTRHIGDFTKRKNHDNYPKEFERSLRDLTAQSQLPKA